MLEVFITLLEVFLSLFLVSSKDDVSFLGSLDDLPRIKLWLLHLDVMGLVDLDQLVDALLNLMILGFGLAPLELGDPVLKLELEILDCDTLAASVKEEELLSGDLEVLSGMVVRMVSFWNKDLNNLVMWLMINNMWFVVVMIVMIMVVIVLVDNTRREANLTLDVDNDWLDNLPGRSWLEVATWVLSLVDLHKVLIFNLNAGVLFNRVGMLDLLQVVTALSLEVLFLQNFDVIVWDLNWL